jgi:thiamine pyrophosphokinase
MGVCYISCAVECALDFSPTDNDLVIGADRGYLNLIKNGIKADVAVGDFDSYDGEIDCENVIRLPKIKDETDGEASIKYAIENGYNNIIVYGAIGGDLDHTIANVSHLKNYTEKGIKITFIDGNNSLFAINNNKMSFSKEANGRISIFSATDKSDGVDLEGLFYELNGATLYNSVPLGVSNEFIGKNSMISVRDGTLFVYTSTKNLKYVLTSI